MDSKLISINTKIKKVKLRKGRIQYYMLLGLINHANKNQSIGNNKDSY